MDNNLNQDSHKKAKKETWQPVNLWKKWNPLNRSQSPPLKWHYMTWSDFMTTKSDLLSNTKLVTWCFSKPLTLKPNDHQRNSMTKDMVHSRSSKKKDLCHITSSWTNHGVRSTLFSMNTYFTPIIRAISHLRNKHHLLSLKLYLVSKKQKWNISSTPNMLGTPSII